MKRHPALIPISREHHQLLLLARLLRKDSPPYKGLPVDLEGKVTYSRKAWKNLIEGHVQLEERVLFPAISRKAHSLSELINELRQEHQELVSRFENLTPEVIALDELGRLLEQHVRKEERLLFQQVQEMLTPLQLEELRALLSSD